MFEEGGLPVFARSARRRKNISQNASFCEAPTLIVTHKENGRETALKYLFIA